LKIINAKFSNELLEILRFHRGSDGQNENIKRITDNYLINHDTRKTIEWQLYPSVIKTKELPNTIKYIPHEN
jgi:hypothetical protein